MIDLFKRLTRIDLRNLTPTQIVIGIIGIVVALAVINFVLNIAQTLLPIAALGLVGYLAYQWLTSRDSGSSTVAGVVKEQETEATKAAQTSVAEADTKISQASDRLRIEQTVNPETGFKEANLARLEAEEQARLAEKKAEESAVQQQLEERRRRLLGGDES